MTEKSRGKDTASANNVCDDRRKTTLSGSGRVTRFYFWKHHYCMECIGCRKITFANLIHAQKAPSLLKFVNCAAIVVVLTKKGERETHKRHRSWEISSFQMSMFLRKALQNCRIREKTLFVVLSRRIHQSKQWV